MKTVKDILAKKGSAVYSILPQTTVRDALKVMAERNVGALLVVDRERVVGIFSERDFARASVKNPRVCEQATVRELMTSNVLYVNTEDSIEDCMAVMSGRRVRHLPVLQNNNLVGVISIGDVVYALIREQKTTIDDLEKYIRGG
jgi:CBS domain-containing protein